MSDDRLITAIGRLERALSRIEARGTPTPRAPALDGRLEELEQRHRRLRAHMQDAIGRIDRLLGAPPSGSNGHGGTG